MRLFNFIIVSRLSKLLTILVLVTCLFAGKKLVNAQTLNPQKVEDARVILLEWFECEECTEGQLAAVLKNSDLLQPMLISALEHGSAPASKALYKYELEKRYDELEAYGKQHPNSQLKISKNEFVDLYLGNFDALYRTRAAIALAKMGDVESRTALEQAAKSESRPDTLNTIKTLLDEM